MFKLFRPFMNVPGVLHQVLLSASDKGIFFAAIFCDNSCLDDSSENQPTELLCKKDILKNFAIFTGNQLH